MLPDWLKSPRRINSAPKSRKPSQIFSCSSFKDIQRIIKESVSEPESPKRPSIFHRVRSSSSVLRSWGHRLAAPLSLPFAAVPNAEKCSIVLYFTSLRVVRRTFEDCRVVRSILRGFRVPIDERDLSMDSDFLNELQGIIGCKNVTLPRVFIGGRYIGGVEEIRQLNEIGELKKLISVLPFVEHGICDQCGGQRFIVCEECNGSHKIYSMKSGFKTCTVCTVNGLVRCPSCCYSLLRRRSIA